MKNFVLYFLILFISVLSAQNEESFEGVITYKITTEFTKDNVPYKEYFKEKYGKTLKIYFNKKGDIFRQIIGSGEYGYDFNLFLNDKNLYFTKWKSLDTLYYYNVSEETLKEISRETGTEGNYKFFKIKGVDPNNDLVITEKFYYNNDLPYIDPILFKNFKDFFWDDYYKISHSPFYKLEINLGNHIVTYTAINIEPKVLEEKIFKLPENIPKKLY